jgi:hypothetical protein
MTGFLFDDIDDAVLIATLVSSVVRILGESACFGYALDFEECQAQAPGTP